MQRNIFAMHAVDQSPVNRLMLRPLLLIVLVVGSTAQIISVPSPPPPSPPLVSPTASPPSVSPTASPPATSPPAVTVPSAPSPPPPSPPFVATVSPGDRLTASDLAASLAIRHPLRPLHRTVATFRLPLSCRLSVPPSLPPPQLLNDADCWDGCGSTQGACLAAAPMAICRLTRGLPASASGNISLGCNGLHCCVSAATHLLHRYRRSLLLRAITAALAATSSPAPPPPPSPPPAPLPKPPPSPPPFRRRRLYRRRHPCLLRPPSPPAPSPPPPSPPSPAQPPPPRVQNLGVECWDGCGSTQGFCAGFCGVFGACCRLGFAGSPAECGAGTEGCDGNHCCVESGGQPPHAPLPPRPPPPPVSPSPSPSPPPSPAPPPMPLPPPPSPPPPPPPPTLPPPPPRLHHLLHHLRRLLHHPSSRHIHPRRLPRRRRRRRQHPAFARPHRSPPPSAIPTYRATARPMSSTATLQPSSSAGPLCRIRNGSPSRCRQARASAMLPSTIEPTRTFTERGSRHTRCGSDPASAIPTRSTCAAAGRRRRPYQLDSVHSWSGAARATTCRL